LKSRQTPDTRPVEIQNPKQLIDERHNIMKIHNMNIRMFVRPKGNDDETSFDGLWKNRYLKKRKTTG
jgi:hypothetical protein